MRCCSARTFSESPTAGVSRPLKHYMIDTSHESLSHHRLQSVWWVVIRWLGESKKRFPNEQAATSIAESLPQEKKNEWQTERRTEEFPPRFALSSALMWRSARLSITGLRVWCESVCRRACVWEGVRAWRSTPSWGQSAAEPRTGSEARRGWRLGCGPCPPRIPN